MTDLNEVKKDLRFERSEVMNDIISARPGFIIRYVFFIYLFILLIVYIFADTIHYRGNVKFTSIVSFEPYLTRNNIANSNDTTLSTLASDEVVSANIFIPEYLRSQIDVNQSVVIKLVQKDVEGGISDVGRIKWISSNPKEGRYLARIQFTQSFSGQIDVNSRTSISVSTKTRKMTAMESLKYWLCSLR
jgi:hypothetical protein